MKDKYDIKLRKDIIKIASQNKLEEASIKFKKYLKIYPNDVIAYCYYVDTLIKLGKFEKVEKILNKIDENFWGDFSFPKLLKAKLLCCKGKYAECLDYTRENIELLKEFGRLPECLIFLKKNLGLLTEKDYKEEKYISKQIIDYEEERALEHIYLRHYKQKDEFNAEFISGFPLKEIYYELRKSMPKEGIIYKDYITCKILFRYEKCGYIDNRVVDYFEVVVLNGTNDIITMYPYKNEEGRLYTDLTPKEVENCPSKRSLSQIDKFNQKYNNS